MFPVHESLDLAFIPAGHGPTDWKQVTSLRQIVPSIRQKFRLRSINLDKLLHVSLSASSLIQWLHAILYIPIGDCNKLRLTKASAEAVLGKLISAFMMWQSLSASDRVLKSPVTKRRTPRFSPVIRRFYNLRNRCLLLLFHSWMIVAVSVG